MDVSEGEPELKRCRQQHVVLYMSNALWYELVFCKWLDLEDLIRVRRTCRTFAEFERLRTLIETRERETFGTVYPKYWNRGVARPFYLSHTEGLRNYVEGHNLPLMLVYIETSDAIICMNVRAVFGNKRRLWYSFKAAMRNAVIPISHRRHVTRSREPLFGGVLFYVDDEKGLRWWVWVRGLTDIQLSVF